MQMPQHKIVDASFFLAVILVLTKMLYRISVVALKLMNQKDSYLHSTYLSRLDMKECGVSSNPIRINV